MNNIKNFTEFLEENTKLFLFGVINKNNKYSIKKTQSEYLDVTKSSEAEILKMMNDNIYELKSQAQETPNAVIDRAIKQAVQQYKKFNKEFQ
ncbi:MAG: hypothetical protein WC679_01155 [Bacteroidales bacterium]|jgi:hypothetical protein